VHSSRLTAIFACMPSSNILVVVIDGLRASALGAYGNTSHPSPVLDEFASESLLLDACYAPSVDLRGIYGSLWQSIHPARASRSAADVATGTSKDVSLPRMLSESGFHTTLVTDEPHLASFVGADDFHERVEVRNAIAEGGLRARAEEISDTNLVRLFSTACEIIERSSDAALKSGELPPQEKESQFIWLHSQGMHGAWDAPLDLQETLLDDDDSPAIEDSAPPNVTMDSGDDPDTAFRFSTAYAAQVMVLDACWQFLMDALKASANSNPWLVVLLGARGFSLGEHRRIGGVDSRLPVEQLHVPCVFQFPDGRGRLARGAELVSHLDIMPTLLEWSRGTNGVATTFDGVSLLPLAAAATVPWRDSLISTGSAAFSLRTSSWCFRGVKIEPPAEGPPTLNQAEALEEKSELFVRPDDRWEANDVSKLCLDAVDDLERRVTDMLSRLAAGDPCDRQASFAGSDGEG
jgi:hypothetical protein